MSILVPFDTEAEAIASLQELDLDRIGDLAHELFGECSEVVTASVVEAVF